MLKICILEAYSQFPFTQYSDLHERVDFVACLGGDGVILHASNLFRGAVPPVVSFNLGSLGFLTSHAVCFLSPPFFISFVFYSLPHGVDFLTLSCSSTTSKKI